MPWFEKRKNLLKADLNISFYLVQGLTGARTHQSSESWLDPEKKTNRFHEVLWCKFLNNNIQATISTKTLHLIPNQWNFTSATLNDNRFVFTHIIKDNERNLCQDLLTIKNTDSDLKVHALYYAALHYSNELLLRVRLSFRELLQTRSTCRSNTKKCLGKE